MAFPLLPHWQDTVGAPLLATTRATLGEAAPQVLKLALVAVLARLLRLCREQGAAALHAQVLSGATDWLWNGLPRSDLAQHIAAATHVPVDGLMPLLDQVASKAVQDLRDLLELSGQTPDDLGELLEGQTESLAGQAPDGLFVLAGLPELQGQQAMTEAAPVDLNESLATLTQMVQAASAQASSTAAPVQAVPSGAVADPPAPGGLRWLWLLPVLLLALVLAWWLM